MREASCRFLLKVPFARANIYRDCAVFSAMEQGGNGAFSVRGVRFSHGSQDAKKRRMRQESIDGTQVVALAFTPTAGCGSAFEIHPIVALN
jgi:hypothetical protein